MHLSGRAVTTELVNDLERHGRAEGFNRPLSGPR
jgi:hypothetical protein